MVFAIGKAWHAHSAAYPVTRFTIRQVRSPVTAFLIILPSLFLTAHAAADKEPPIYPQAMVGLKGGFQIGTDQHYPDDNPTGAVVGAFGGLRFSKAWRWELGYQYHDALAADFTGVEIQTRLVESAVRYDAYWRDNVSFYGRLGAAYWEMEKQSRGVEALTASAFSPLSEVGASYHLTPQLQLSAGYQYIDAIGQFHTGKYDSHTFLLGLSYTFGRHPKASAVKPGALQPRAVQPKAVAPVVSAPAESAKPATQTVVLASETYRPEFALNSSIFRDQDAVQLQRIIQILLAHPKARAKVVGHTDASGPESYNLWLSKRRAQAVVDVLIQAGVDPGQLEACGEGETAPLASNDTAEGRAHNRRVELTVTGFDAPE